MNDHAVTVLRTPKPKGSARFVAIDNAVIQDPRLSFRARGVLAYVLSKPTTWEHSAESLAAASTEGVEAIRSALRELERFGFAEFRKLRIEGGRFKSVRLFRESPDRDFPDPVNPSPAEPGPEEPTPGKAEPGSAEPGQCRFSENMVSETTVSEKTEKKENTGGEIVLPPSGDIAFPWRSFPELPDGLRESLLSCRVRGEQTSRAELPTFEARRAARATKRREVRMHAYQQAFREIMGRKLRYKDSYPLDQWLIVIESELKAATRPDERPSRGRLPTDLTPEQIEDMEDMQGRTAF